MKNKHRHARFRHGRSRPGKRERVEAREPPSKAARSSELTGELRLHRDGYGFVIATRKDDDDVFIPARFIGDALNGDVVLARVVAGREGKLEGRIIKICERKMGILMGRLEYVAQAYQVVADDMRVRHRILVSPDKLLTAKPGNNVVVRILKYPVGALPMAGEVIEVLGNRGEESTEKSAVITRHQLKREFPRSAVKEAEAAFDLMNRGSLEGRRDLRKIPFVTIDGETARDFDDAVAVERQDGGFIRLWVSIADVSFFVRTQTALDSAAYERGTSVYFPGDCIPMLPEQISNNLCSLIPNEDRLTMTAEMLVDQKGRVARRDFYPSVIHSKERMTYTSIKKILVDKDRETLSRYQDLLPSFELMEECHKKIRADRIRRGSIDFDLPEPEIIIDMQGDVSGIARAERHVGHMMIEDFMIAANESVAEFLTERKVGCIYRVHEPPPPDKLREFAILLNNLGHKANFGKDTGPRSLAKIVGTVKGRPEERLVNHMLLRSMSRAAYSPENKGHFGLASRCYCHFTSPIRRYPDLIVHRLLRVAFANSHIRAPGLAEMSEHSSRRERVAMEAERETAKLYACMFMQEHVGGTFEGIISHVTKFGFFVELIEFFVEGLVSMDSLTDDRYYFEEKGMIIRARKKRKSFKIGDRVKIEVSEVNIPDREIVFTLV